MKDKILYDLKKAASVALMALCLAALNAGFAAPGVQAAGGALAIGSQSASSGQEIIAPITAANSFADIGSIMLHIDYDSSLLSYSDPGFTPDKLPSSAVIAQSGNRITVLWYDFTGTNPISFNSGDVLLKLNFKVISSGSAIADIKFDPASIIGNSGAIEIPAVFTGGSVVLNAPSSGGGSGGGGSSAAPQAPVDSPAASPAPASILGNSSPESSNAASNQKGKVMSAESENIANGDIIQCKSCSNPFAVYIVKITGGVKYIRHIASLEIFSHYKHLKWENLKQVSSLDDYSMSGWVRFNTGLNGTAGPADKVYEINGDQTKHWINMTAEQFLSHGGSEPAIFSVNRGELDLYSTGPDVMTL